MVFYNLDEVKEGMILADSLFDRQGNLLIAGGFTLKKNHIEMLRLRGFVSIPIAVTGMEKIVPEKVISHQTELELISVFDKSSKAISSIMAQSRKNNEKISDIIEKDKGTLSKLIRDTGILTAAIKLVEDVSHEPWTIVNLNRMREASDNLLEHSINVAIIALCIGQKYRLPAHEMKQLGLGALNYDIGMLAVPPSILEKQTALTDEERLLLQQHTTYGYLMLKGNPEIPPTSAIVALSHHEYQDGSGYPQNMTAENRPPLKDFSHQGCIHRFAQIVAVADTYAMLIHGRQHFQQRMDPLHAAKKLVEYSKTKLNADIVKTLLGIFPVYPLGARIKIVHGPIADLDNAIGAVSKVYPDHIASPQITIFESARHHSLPKPIILELAQYKGFSLELLN